MVKSIRFPYGILNLVGQLNAVGAAIDRNLFRSLDIFSTWGQIFCGPLGFFCGWCQYFLWSVEFFCVPYGVLPKSAITMDLYGELVGLYGTSGALWTFTGN